MTKTYSISQITVGVRVKVIGPKNKLIHVIIGSQTKASLEGNKWIDSNFISHWKFTDEKWQEIILNTISIFFFGIGFVLKFFVIP